MKTKIIHVLPHNIYKFFPECRFDNSKLSNLDHHIVRFIYNIISYDLNNELDHELWIIGDNNTEVLHKHGFKIRVFRQDFRIFLPLETSFSIIKGIKSYLRENNEKKTIWHVHSYYLWMFDFLVIYLKLKNQIIFAHHRGGGFTWKALPYSIYKYIFVLPIILRFCRYIFVQNKTELETVSKKYFISRSKIVYFPNSVKASVRKKEYFLNNLANICFLGRLEKIKGIDDILKISKRLKESGKNFKITFIGDGSLKNYTSKFCELNEINYEITGWKSKEEVENYLLKQDLLLIANKKAEGSSNSVIEAQSIGLPVISYDIEGVNDIVINGETGFLVDTLDEYYERVLQLIEDRDLLVDFSKKSVLNTLANFNREAYFEKIVKIYTEV